MSAAALPTGFHVTTPHGAVGLWWLHLPAASRAAQRQQARQQAAQLLDRQFPARSLAHIHWPPGAQHPPNLAYAAQAWPDGVAAQAAADAHLPDLWLSWSYLPALPATDAPTQALLAIAPLPVGVDVSAGSLLAPAAWADVLRLYGGLPDAPPDAAACARLWAQLEAADKCLRTGLQEWSAPVAAGRARCTLVDLPLPHADLAAALAWLPPSV